MMYFWMTMAVTALFCVAVISYLVRMVVEFRRMREEQPRRIVKMWKDENLDLHVVYEYTVDEE